MNKALEGVWISQIELMSKDSVMVVFSNGDAVRLESAKVKHLALTEGAEYISNDDTDE